MAQVENTRIEFEFLGGPRDGERLVGTLVGEYASAVGALYRQTGGAQVGQRFWSPCEYSLAALRTIPWEQLTAYEAAGYRFRGHIYEICVRFKSEQTLVIRTRHIGAAE